MTWRLIGVVVGEQDAHAAHRRGAAAGGHGAGAEGAARGGSRFLRRLKVRWKVEPSPSRLASTVMSPPIMRASWREIARPRPEPPNLRVVATSAWVKTLKSFSVTSLLMPMPGSMTVDRDRALRRPAGAWPPMATSTLALRRELDGVGERGS